MDTTEIGTITELECTLAFLKLGWSVSLPYGNNKRYDFIAEKNNKFLRIQCKHSRWSVKNENFIISTCSKVKGKRKSYSKKEIDYFATTFNGVTYLIPVEICPKSEMILRVAPTKNSQNKFIRWAKDFEIEKILK